MNLDNLVNLKKETTVFSQGCKEDLIHVGAIENKLEDLRQEITKEFDIGFLGVGVEDDDMFTEITMDGKIKGQPYSIKLKHVKMPVFRTMGQMHHASIVSPATTKDIIGPIIYEKFATYELELKQSQRQACEIMQRVEAEGADKYEFA
jgi:hypothetical protein